MVRFGFHPSLCNETGNRCFQQSDCAADGIVGTAHTNVVVIAAITHSSGNSSPGMVATMS